MGHDDLLFLYHGSGIDGEDREETKPGKVEFDGFRWFGIQRILVIRSELLQVAIRDQPVSLPAVCEQHYARVAEI